MERWVAGELVGRLAPEGMLLADEGLRFAL